MKPKYGFEDAVSPRDGRQAKWEIRAIHRGRSAFNYDIEKEGDQINVWEVGLELYVEPEKPKARKLFAYESGGFIQFKRHDSNIHPCDKDVIGVDCINWEHVYKRIPEFDIDYSRLPGHYEEGL